MSERFRPGNGEPPHERDEPGNGKNGSFRRPKNKKSGTRTKNSEKGKGSDQNGTEEERKDRHRTSRPQGRRVDEVAEGVAEYFDNRDQSGFTSERETTLSTTKEIRRDMVPARTPRSERENVVTGRVSVASFEDRNKALAIKQEDIHLRGRNTEERNQHTVHELKSMTIRTLEEFDSRYPHIASLQALVNEFSKDDIHHIDEWRPELSLALKELGYAVEGNPEHGDLNVEVDSHGTKVTFTMPVVKALSILRKALRIRQNLIPREPFRFSGTIPPKVLDDISPSELEDIMGPNGVHKSIKKALAVLGYKNPQYMLRSGREVVEVTRSIQGRLRGTKYEIPADALRAFLQKQIDAYHDTQDPLDTKTIELPPKAIVDAEAVRDDGVIDVTGGIPQAPKLDFIVDGTHEGYDVAHPEDVKNALHTFLHTDKDIDEPGESTLEHVPGDPDDDQDVELDTIDMTATGTVANELSDDVFVPEYSESEEDFINQVAKLGLKVLSHKGDLYTIQGGVFGTKPITVKKAELLEVIEDRTSGNEDETYEEEANKSLNIAHIDPEVAAIFAEVPKDAENGTPRMTDEHGNALLTPAELHRRFVQPTLREEFVGPHIPEDLRKVRQSIEDLPAEERDSDVANAPLTPDSSEPYRKLVEQARENIKKYEVPFFDTRFQSEFNISEKDLESIEGYATLSPAQKKLLFENLSQVTLRNVKEEAERLCTEHANQKRLDLVEKVNVVLGNALASFREVITRDRDRIDTEKEVLKNMRESGIEVHRNVLEQLVTSVLKFGPRIHEAENGKLLADLVNIRERATGDLRGEEWLVSEKLNRAAHEFAKIPASWRGNTIGVDDGSEWKITAFIKDKIKIFTSDERKHQRVYEEAKSEYEQARKELANVLLKKGLGEAQVMAKIIEIDSRVYQLQTIQTNPDALAELGNIENQEFWKEVGQKLAFPGMYIGLGLLGRSLLSLGGAAVAAPIVSGGVAWLRSWNSSADALRSRDEKARAGIKDTGEGALNVVTAEDLTKKTLRILDRYRKETDPEKIVSLLAQLQARVKYVNTKQEKRQINYGKRENSLMAQIELMETVGEALAVIAREDLASTLVVQDRLQKSDRRVEKRLSETEKMILSARLEGRNSEALRSAEKAAAFSLAGSLIADFYHNWRADSLSRQSLSSGPQTAFKGDVPFVPTPIVNGETDVQGGVSFEERILEGRDFEQLIPRTPGIDTLGGTESDPGTLNNSPQIETNATVATEVNTGTYTIKSGDTLTKILKEQIPEIKELSTPQAREIAVAKVLSRLKPSELRAIGIESEKADIIRAGDRIDIAKLKEVVNVDLGLTEASGVVQQGASISSEALRSPAVGGEGVSGTTILQEQPVRPGPIRPESSGLTPSTMLVTPRAEVVSPPNNVVELAPLREAKAVQERVIETLKLKKDWSAVSGRFTSDLSEAVRTNSAESPALRRALKDALFAEQTLIKTLKLEERTNETVGEFMKRAAKEIAKLSPEAQNELYEKITPKGRGIFDSGEAVFRPGQVRPGSIEHGAPLQTTPETIVAPQPAEQPPVAPKPAPEASKTVVLRGDVPPPKMSSEFNKYLINGRQIPLQSWVALREKPVSNFEFMDIQIGDVLKDPTVPSDTKKMIFLRRLLFEETGLAGKSGEKLEDYFKRADDFIQGHKEVKDRYLNRIVGPYQEFVREIDNTSTYESSPKKVGGV